MLRSFLMLLLFQLAGESLSRAFHLPLPGPVLGMALLTVWLLWRPPSHELQSTTRSLLGILSLLFVPAGVGIVASLGLLRAQWFPIAVGLFGSTLLSLVGTAWVMHAILNRSAGADTASAEEPR